MRSMPSSIFQPPPIVTFRDSRVKLHGASRLLSRAACVKLKRQAERRLTAWLTKPTTNSTASSPMGDKSPKSVNKVSKQKQAKAATATQKKAQDVAAKKSPAGAKKK